jgi:hypothetical protein
MGHSVVKPSEEVELWVLESGPPAATQTPSGEFSPRSVTVKLFQRQGWSVASANCSSSAGTVPGSKFRVAEPMKILAITRRADVRKIPIEEEIR